MESKSLDTVPGLQEVLEALKSSAVLIGIFLDILTKMISCFQFGIATVERDLKKI